MPIFIPQTELDIAIAETRKADGILDEMPVGGFTLADVMKRMGRQQARLWVERNGTYIGLFGPKGAKVYRLNKQRVSRRKSK